MPHYSNMPENVLSVIHYQILHSVASDWRCKRVWPDLPKKPGHLGYANFTHVRTGHKIRVELSEPPIANVMIDPPPHAADVPGHYGRLEEWAARKMISLFRPSPVVNVSIHDCRKEWWVGPHGMLLRLTSDCRATSFIGELKDASFLAMEYDDDDDAPWALLANRHSGVSWVRKGTRVRLAYPNERASYTKLQASA